MQTERGVGGPSLVVVPLSVLPSWMSEFKRWAPSMRVVRFHCNDVQERLRLRREVRPGPAPQALGPDCHCSQLAASATVPGLSWHDDGMPCARKCTGATSADCEQDPAAVLAWRGASKRPWGRRADGGTRLAPRRCWPTRPRSTWP